jgi:hypothetical protein
LGSNDHISTLLKWFDTVLMLNGSLFKHILNTKPFCPVLRSCFIIQKNDIKSVLSFWGLIFRFLLFKVPKHSVFFKQCLELLLNKLKTWLTNRQNVVNIDTEIYSSQPIIGIKCTRLVHINFQKYKVLSVNLFQKQSRLMNGEISR